jgi:hypothetical protein
MTAEPGEPLLVLPDVDPTHLGRDALGALSQRFSSAPTDEFILAVARAPGLSWGDGQDRPITYLEIHDRDWWLDLERPGNRAHLLRTIVAAALRDALDVEVTVAWVARVLPAVVDIRSVTVKDDGVRIVLRRRSHGSAVPEDLSDEIHPLDFTDFSSALSAAHATTALPHGGTVVFADDQ